MRTKEQNRESIRRWRIANPDKAHAISRTSARRWRIANPDKAHAASCKWRIANPERVRETRRKWYAANSEKAREIKRKWRQDNPNKVRAHSYRGTLKRLYNITPEQHNKLIAIQGGCCAVCGKADEKLHIDHDHSTNAVRGLLCFNCNFGLGHFHDNPIILQGAINYLCVHGRR